MISSGAISHHNHESSVIGISVPADFTVYFGHCSAWVGPSRLLLIGYAHVKVADSLSATVLEILEILEKYQRTYLNPRTVPATPGPRLSTLLSGPRPSRAANFLLSLRNTIRTTNVKIATRRATAAVVLPPGRYLGPSEDGYTNEHDQYDRIKRDSTTNVGESKHSYAQEHSQ